MQEGAPTSRSSTPLGRSTNAGERQPQARIRGAGFFLTYSQVGDANIDLVEEQVVNPRLEKLKAWAAVEETHQDEGRHWHVFIHFKSSLQIRGHTLFDIKTLDGRTLHPNIKPSRCSKVDLRRIWEYLNKTGNPLKGTWTMDMCVLIFLLLKSPPEKKNAYRDALLCDTREAFLDTIKQGDARSYVIYHDKILSFADKNFAPVQEEYEPPFINFTDIPEEVTNWLSEEFPKRDRPKSLVLWGPSRTGKTSWARSLGPHCYMNTWWNADKMDSTKDYVIFDDINFDSFSGWQAFFGAQQEFEMTDKYRGKRTWKRDWLDANCVVVYLDHPLYSLEAPEVPPTPVPLVAEEDTRVAMTPQQGTPDHFEDYIRRANAEFDEFDSFIFGRRNYLDTVKEHAKHLYQKDAFNGLRPIELDTVLFNRSWDKWMNTYSDVNELD
ncbi:hypothetical protein H4582DRAFT_1824401 [Lactarius indigo]|nr:hypothetical protein H4582DRAFT_1824378 [Lactarius indigo]KAI9430305.1 hypothetical protein H4582DRAFT_1824427 [Lactarius indigo]KAI9430308.1 hypothetical protein H4582DRAFT_1824372 [Lactarius indigo]KAI9430311.1 hypothetical protein H4582DRAFT_1824371 [Lactarius indigo]KAI9430321.1 hypothetical protein H4582DRAFT_1824401 [Lactarius indigo]